MRRWARGVYGVYGVFVLVDHLEGPLFSLQFFKGCGCLRVAYCAVPCGSKRNHTPLLGSYRW